MTNHLFDGLFQKAVADKTLATLPDGSVWSYGAALDFSGQLANTLVAMDIKPGDRVAVQVPKSLEAVLLYLACVRAGAVFLPLNTAYTAAEVSYFVGDSGARLLVCNPKDESAPRSDCQFPQH